MQVTDVNLFGDVFKLFDTIYPKGYVYTQYPGQKDPNELWGDISTWEMLDYGGAFFRAANGSSEEFEKSLVISNLNGTNITFEEEHSLKKGSILYDPEGNESRIVTEITDTYTVVIDRVFTSTTITNVLIGQYDCFQNITGRFGSAHTIFGDTKGVFTASGRSSYYYAGGSQNANPRYVYLDTSNDPNLRTGTETRPSNLTYQLWRRVN